MPSIALRHTLDLAPLYSLQIRPSEGNLRTGQGGLVIQTNGDVTFGDYTGGLLRVAAAGSIIGGRIYINEPTTSSSSGNIPALTLQAGTPAQQSLGNIKVAQINASGRNQDVVLFATGSIEIPGLEGPGERFAIGSFVDNSATAKAGNITIGAGRNITIGSEPIRYHNLENGKNTYSYGAINASVNSSDQSGLAAADAGTISITSREGNITVIGGIFTNSSAKGADAGNSGDIKLEALQGTVTVATNPVGALVTTTKSDPDSDGTTGRTGNAGTITVNARAISIAGRRSTDAPDITTQSTRTGTSGAILLSSQTPLELKDITIATDARDGDSGAITIAAPSIALINTIINTSTTGTGDAGSVEVAARDAIALQGSQIFSQVEATGTGQGGNVTLDAPLIRVSDQSLIKTDSKSNVSAPGNLTLQGRDRVEINNSTVTSDSKNDSAGFGEVRIQATQGIVSLSQANVSARNDREGVAGDIYLLASDRIEIINNSEVAGNGEFGRIFVGTDGLFEFGLSDITPPQSIIIRDSELTATNENIEGERSSGGITLIARGGTEISRSTLNTFTTGAGDGGRISIQATNFTLQDGSQLIASTRGQGNAGNVAITAESLLINKGQIRSRSRGEGNAGQIKIETRSLKLDHASSITAETQSGSGGNIFITSEKQLLLRRNSSITASAGSQGKPGAGGSITIKAPQGFVIAVPSEDSNIIANAFGGKGGSIKIDANRVFGFQLRSRLSQADLLQIDKNGSSDISASSDVGADGEISINTIQVDPSQGLTEIPVDLVDPSRLIAQSCQPGSATTDRRSEFVITGRGGLPPSPGEAQTGNVSAVPWVSAPETIQTTRLERSSAQPSTASSLEASQGQSLLLEAQGITIAADGSPFLTAQATTTASRQPSLSNSICASQSSLPLPHKLSKAAMLLDSKDCGLNKV